MTQPESHDDRTLWAAPADSQGPPPPADPYAVPYAAPTIATGPYPPPTAGGVPYAPTAGGAPYPPPTGPYPPVPPVVPSGRNRRIAIIASVAAVVVAAVVTTVVLVFSGPSVGDVAGTWTQKQSLGGMGLDQTLVVSGDRFTYTLAITGGDGMAILGGGLLGGLFGAPGGPGGMMAGVQCAGRVDVDGDGFVFASSTGPCGTIHGTLHGSTLTLHGSGRSADTVELVRQ